jgi:hypothetical protein
MDIRYPEKAKRMVFVSKWINSFINILDGSSIRRFQAFFHIRVVDASASIILLVIVSRWFNNATQALEANSLIVRKMKISRFKSAVKSPRRQKKLPGIDDEIATWAIRTALTAGHVRPTLQGPASLPLFFSILDWREWRVCDSGQMKMARVPRAQNVYRF